MATEIHITVVFGPDRPMAARRAVEALRVARERLAASSPFLPDQYDRLLAAMREAEKVRAQYYEYGDSLFDRAVETAHSNASAPYLDGAGGNRGQSFATLSDVRRHVAGLS